MRLAVMQPYFLPYVDYFKLMAAVDRFVIYDDVNYINKGWINRNRILLNDAEYKFTVPLKRASQNRCINEIVIAIDTPWRAKLLRTIEQAYRHAAYFDEVFPLASQIINFQEENLSLYLRNSLLQIKFYLEINCEIILSSTIYGNDNLKGQNRILDICGKENATTYINLSGGKGLYEHFLFNEKNIVLKFLIPISQTYCQFGRPFVPWLSILDVLMFNGRKTTSAMLATIELE